ncbi:class I adenylate-forming enzyme family protein [Streptomyces sp. cg40]|uniref:class I adenylate-forming enzyme family protein n=1 Tax=Streptomyces sp. cg40 TaxID=3419764 RepID=UPI003D07FED0
MRIVSELLQDAVRWIPDRVFIDDGTRSMTYRDVDRMAARLANVLADQGVGPDVPVCVYLPNCPDLAVGYLACLRLGAIFVPVASMAREREVCSIAERTEAPVIVTGSAGAAVAVAAVRQIPSLRVALAHGGPAGGCLDLDDLLSAASDERPLERRRLEDVAAVFFTSGTTGEPKGAMQTHGSIYSTVRDMATFNRFRFGKETLLDVLPMFNNFGATCLMLTALYSGGTLIVHERWETERVLSDIARHRVTYFAGTPTMLIYLWKGFRPGEHDLSSLRLVIAGGAPVAPDVVEACENELGIARVSQIYGATEVSGYVTGDPVEGARRPGSAGPAFGSSRIAIVDDDGVELPRGEIGEVVISGDTVGPGYWRDPETTAAFYSTAGWRSGDLGLMDHDGCLSIVDRKKDLVISGGYNIYPLEVENILYRHPRVRLCAVVGTPDKVKGELAVAFVVATDPSQELAAELIALCRTELMAYKVPRHVEFIDDMPLGPTGKILKRELRGREIQLPAGVRS